MIARENAVKYTVALINELNGDNYKLENFEEDSNILIKLLNTIGMRDIDEDLDLVKEKCNKELRVFGVTNPEITYQDKRFILKYL